MPPKNDPNEYIHELDKRTTVLETEFLYVKEIVGENKKKLEGIDTKVDTINESIVRQNGSLPRLENNMDVLLKQFEHIHLSNAQRQIRSKLMWALISALTVSLGVVIVKTLIGV